MGSVRRCAAVSMFFGDATARIRSLVCIDAAVPQGLLMSPSFHISFVSFSVQRGMLDSGQHKRARERAYGAQQMAQMGSMTMQEEARLQLDRQRSMLEENLYGGLESDAIANAMRRFTLTQALQGMV